jgi:hypothetical protein
MPPASVNNLAFIAEMGNDFIIYVPLIAGPIYVHQRLKRLFGQAKSEALC